MISSKVLGRNPGRAELNKVRQSPNYLNGKFQNLSPTRMMLPEASYLTLMMRMFSRPERSRPKFPLPSVSTDLETLNGELPTCVWFGHSSYMIAYKGFNILVDPVLSGYASPTRNFGKAFEGSNVYKASRFPDIDILILSHDHYDHMDYQTLIQLAPRTKQFCVPLGVDSHLKYWGVDASKIIALDWWEEASFFDRFTITAAPARHFSGRAFGRNATLWSSYVLRIGDEYSFFLGGDSGFDTHFREIGRRFGPFDLAFLECGQYDRLWPYIHMMPEQTVRAAAELRAKVFVPVHWGKFALALHSWDDPIRRVVAEAEKRQVELTTPMIGEPFGPGNYPRSQWWEESIKKEDLTF